ncbi:MAG: Efflux transporter, RND family, MFP subunit [Candidatus Peribacteria bacterium GW2011_GWC2_54_8]|nr:MAG: Efflux transporter, RND family, MFP subunit [Candidatus Peribacteria bacterium GW2011_GWC2_54_8]
MGDNLLADANETKYVVLENPDYFIVTVQLDQVDVVHVKEGQKASIVFDALPEETFEGVIDFIDTTPIQSSGVVSYEVEIALQPTGHTILSGMTAKVEIEIDARENVVAVPNLALRAIGNSSFVVGENGERFPVETGLSDGTYTEVLSGLQEGAKIQSVNVSISSNQDGERSERSSNNAQMIMRMGGPPR